MKAYRAQIQSFIDGIHGKPMTPAAVRLPRWPAAARRC
jgi:hypothetical protein